MAGCLTEVVKAQYREKIGYLVLDQDKMAFVDLNPRVVKEDPSLKKTAAVTALFGVLGAAVYAAKSGQVVDTEEKKQLREIFENYCRTGEKSQLGSVSMNQVLKAGSYTKDRVIPCSSISEVSVKKPKRINITQNARTGLAADLYGSSINWEFNIMSDDKQFQTLTKLVEQAHSRNKR